MLFFGDKTNLRMWGAVAAVLVGALTLAGCPTRETGTEMDTGGEVAPDASSAKPDAGTGTAGGGATSSNGGASGSGGSRASNGGLSGSGGSRASTGGAPPTDAGTQPPQPNQACTIAAQCASGFCVDGVCCDTACDGACVSCAQTGKVGTCSAVKNAADDACTGDSMCDGAGACKKALGKICSSPDQCVSGHCIDGVCCGTASCGSACQSCSVAGFEGTCAPVARFVERDGCSGTKSCNGLGECRGKSGSMCASAADCVTVNCVDGVCCNTACDGLCVSCNQAQSPGTCLPITGGPDPSPATPCGGVNICAVGGDGQPACKLKSGRTCSANADCASGTCQSIFVPPDPNDPFDSGYTYTACE